MKEASIPSPPRAPREVVQTLSETGATADDGTQLQERVTRFGGDEGDRELASGRGCFTRIVVYRTRNWTHRHSSNGSDISAELENEIRSSSIAIGYSIGFPRKMGFCGFPSRGIKSISGQGSIWSGRPWTDRIYCMPVLSLNQREKKKNPMALGICRKNHHMAMFGRVKNDMI